MKILILKSVYCKKKKIYIKSTPEITAENILNRKFYADGSGKKWFTNVTEMKYDANSKAYLIVILALSEKSIVLFVLGYSNKMNCFKDISYCL